MNICTINLWTWRTEFPILVCDLSTDTIIGTDTFGSILLHTLDIRNGLLFTDGTLQWIAVHGWNTSTTSQIGSILLHTLDIRNGLLFTDGTLQWIAVHGWNTSTTSQRCSAITVGHCSIHPHSEAVLHCTTQTVGGRALPPSGLLEGLTVFSENTGLVVGRTLVDPSGGRSLCWCQTSDRKQSWWSPSRRSA